MQNKLKPGDTFTKQLDGTTYAIRVLSADQSIEAYEARDRAAETKNNATLVRALIDTIRQHVDNWDRAEKLDEVGSLLTEDDIIALWYAVLAGNRPDEEELKN